MARSAADAFLEAILQNPDDDTPRLIFADWLEEQGDSSSVARAEFIRVQCAIAKTARRSDRARHLEMRQDELLACHGKRWSGSLSRLVRSWTFHRGFIDEVDAATETFSLRPEKLFRIAPIQHLHLSPSNRHVRWLESISALADCPHLARLRSLSLQHHALRSADIQALSVCEHLPRLVSLDLSANYIGDAGVRALVHAPFFPRLSHLNLQWNEIGPAGVRLLSATLQELSSTQEGLRLRRLDLGYNPQQAAARRIIAAAPLVRRVVRW